MVSERVTRSLAVVLVLVVLAGCGSAPPATPAAASPSPSGGASIAPSPSAASAEPSVSGGPSASPSPSEPAPSPSPAATSSERITVLLLGIDAGNGRRSLRTDTIMVASIDPIGKTASFLSVPRDLVDVPLADGTRYRGKINALVADVTNDPSRFPGGAKGGEAVLAAALERFLGLDIPYWAVVDFDGFKAIVKAVDGVDVFAFRGLCDTTYRDDRFGGYEIAKGRWHLDPREALAYARVRKPPPESDFTRTIRQVQLLLGLRAAVIASGLTVDPVAALESIGVVRTTVPSTVLEELAGLAPAITDDRVFRKTLWPPDFVDEKIDSRGYVVVAKPAAVASVVGQLFPPVGQPIRTGSMTQYVSATTAKDFVPRRATC